MTYDIQETMHAYKGLIHVRRFPFNGLKLDERGSMPLANLKHLIYSGSELKKITNSFIESLREDGLEVSLTKSDFAGVIIEKFPYFKDVAFFTDKIYVDGKVAIRVTGVHHDNTITPLLDFHLDGTEKCEKELFGKYTGLPDFRDIQSIIKYIRENRKR